MTKDEQIAKLERRVAELTNVILTLEDFARETQEQASHLHQSVKSARMLGLIGTERLPLL